MFHFRSFIYIKKKNKIKYLYQIKNGLKKSSNIRIKNGISILYEK